MRVDAGTANASADDLPTRSYTRREFNQSGVFMCFGGSSPSAPTAPPPPPPPPQLAQTPAAAAVRADTAALNAAQGGSGPGTTLLTGGLGDASPLTNNLGKKTLLGQ